MTISDPLPGPRPDPARLAGHHGEAGPRRGTGPPDSQVVRPQSGRLGDPGREHSRADLGTIVAGECEIGPALPLQYAMRGPGLPIDSPANAQRGGQHASGLGRRPGAQAGTANRDANPSGTASPCSTRSASTRSPGPGRGRSPPPGSHHRPGRRAGRGPRPTNGHHLLVRVRCGAASATSGSRAVMLVAADDTAETSSHLLHPPSPADPARPGPDVLPASLAGGLRRAREVGRSPRMLRTGRSSPPGNSSSPCIRTPPSKGRDAEHDERVDPHGCEKAEGGHRPPILTRCQGANSVVGSAHPPRLTRARGGVAGFRGGWCDGDN